MRGVVEEPQTKGAWARAGRGSEGMSLSFRDGLD